ncbi:MAG: hypothetical protein ACLFRX_09185 [Gemmatimonadota bacterium]
MIELLILGAAVGGIGAGYVRARRFVRERLRFVDAVQKPVAPVVVGAVGVLAAAPVVWLLPVVGGGTAILFGAGVGLGVRHGARDIRRNDRLLPDIL